MHGESGGKRASALASGSCGEKRATIVGGSLFE